MSLQANHFTQITMTCNFYRYIKPGWGTHLNELTTRGTRFLPGSKLHMNHLELKAVFLALKGFQDLCIHKIVLVEMNNTTVVSYFNKEGGMRSSPLCALPWRTLTWCTRNQVTLKARRIPGRLRVVADKLARPLKEWSLLQEVFQAICNRQQRLQIDLFAILFNNKLPLCHQYQIPWPQQWIRSVCHGRIRKHTPSHYQPYRTSVILQDSPCKRIIWIAPGWPNIPWFWDPVAKSGQIPLSLPNLLNLLTQPFNQIPHRNLTNINLDAQLLEPQYSRSRASLRRWQQELRLLRGSTRSVYEAKWTIFTSGASLIRWTSGYPC